MSVFPGVGTADRMLSGFLLSGVCWVLEIDFSCVLACSTTGRVSAYDVFLRAIFLEQNFRCCVIIAVVVIVAAYSL